MQTGDYSAVDPTADKLFHLGSGDSDGSVRIADGTAFLHWIANRHEPIPLAGSTYTGKFRVGLIDFGRIPGR